ncbi:DUF86 domain-containing protein [Sinobaca sp. H24]|uniref:DUF86 domain-containing protein n=1 Tax=Sinobaca sp. H24 TaxID=2923376 RepID=UPI0020795AB9|nr:DUF86 domain-containing protein [Sinobaca sp. H24]
MYFVDREKIEAQLAYIESLYEAVTSFQSMGDMIQRLALERLAQGWIEAIIDTGNQMIDGFIMRDPGSYEDILAILEDEKVIPDEVFAGLTRLIKLRKTLTRDYMEIDHDVLWKNVQSEAEYVKQFPDCVRTYIEKELGPVSAFLPENKQDNN